MCKGGESKRITVMTRPGDVIAGGSGGMGPSKYMTIKMSYNKFILGLY